MKILLDSGASQSIIKLELVKNFNLKSVESTSWNTVAGNFSTSKQTNVVFSSPKLHKKRTITSVMHVTEKLNNYDMILGRDLLLELGIILNFQEGIIQWENTMCPMQTTNQFLNYQIQASIEDSNSKKILLTE